MLKSITNSIKSQALRNEFIIFLIFVFFSLLFFIGIFAGWYYDQTSFLSIWNPWAAQVKEAYLINPVFSDQPDYSIPFLEDFYNSPSLWNKDIIFGTPFGLMLFNGLFYPLNFLLFFLDNQRAITLTYILRSTLSGYFMYLFLKDMKLSRQSGIIAGVLYMFSAQALQTIGITIGYLLPFIPLYFLAINKIFDSQFKHKIPFLALVTAICVLSGFPSIIAFTFIFAGFYFLYLVVLDRRKSHLHIFNYVMATFLGFMLVAFILLPSAEFFQNTDLGYRESYWRWQFQSRNLMHFINPYFFGNSLYGTWWGGSQESEQAGYAGILTFLLFIPSAYLMIRKKTVKFLYFPLVTLIILAIIFNFLGVLQITRYLPVFSFNPSTRIIIILHFFSITTAAYGIDHFFKEKNVLKDKIFVLLLGLAFALYIFLTIYIPNHINRELGPMTTFGQIKDMFVNRFGIFELPVFAAIAVLVIGGLAYIYKANILLRHKLTLLAFAVFTLSLGSMLYLSEGDDAMASQIPLWKGTYIVHSFTIAILAILMLAILFIRRKPYTLAAFIIATLAFIDLYAYSGLYNTPTKHETYFPKGEEIGYLEENLNENDRMLSVNRAFLPNVNMVYDIPTLQGHHITSKQYKQLLRHLDGDYLTEAGTLDFFSENMNFETPFIDLFNIKYIVTDSEFSPELQGIVYQKNFNHAINLDQQIEQTFTLNKEAQFNIVSFRISDYLLVKPIDVTLTLSDSGKTLFSQTQQITNENRVSWIYLEASQDLTLEPEKEYKLTVELDRQPTSTEFVKVDCCAGVDCLPKGKLLNNSQCTDISFKVLDKVDLSQRYKLVHTGSINIFENISKERAQVRQVKKIVFYENEEDFAQKTANEDILETAFLPKEVQADFEEIDFTTYPTDSMEFSSYNNDSLTIQANVEEDSFILLPDTYYPGWKLNIDGEEAKLYKTDLIFRGFQLPAGSHTISMKYEPDSFLQGAIISITAVIILILVFIKKTYEKTS